MLVIHYSSLVSHHVFKNFLSLKKLEIGLRYRLNASPNNTILGWSEFNALAGNISGVAQMPISVCEDIAGKGENVGQKHIFLLLQMLLKTLFFTVNQSWDCGGQALTDSYNHINNGYFMGYFDVFFAPIFCAFYHFNRLHYEIYGSFHVQKYD